MPLLDILGSIMDATHPTQANPYYGAQQVTPDQYSASAPPGAKVPTTNIWLDAHGNDVTDHMKGLSSDQINQMTSTPYQAPSFWARLGRNGKEIANLNAQAQDLLGQQVQQRANARTIAGRDWATLDPKLQSLLGNNPEQAKTLLGNDFRGQNIEGVGQSLSDINSGLPGLRTASNVASANAQIPLANNQAAIQKRLASNGYPTTEADNQSIGALNSLTQGIGENGLIPKRLSLQDLQLTGANAAQPNFNKEIYNNAAVGAGTSEQNVNDLPSAIQYLHNRALLSTGTSGQDVQNMPLTNLASGANAITGAYESLHPNAPYNPMAAQVDPSTGTITPGRNLQNTIMGQVAGQIGGGGVTAPSGTTYIKPASNGPINPLIYSQFNSLSAPTTQNTTSAPQPQLQGNQQWGVGNSITGIEPPQTDLPIGADEALRHLGMKLDKDGNLQKINDWMTIPPESVAQGQKIQALVKSGKLAPTGKSHAMRQLLTHYLGSHLPTGSLNQGY